MEDLQDVNNDLQIRNPQLRVNINRDLASFLGLTANQIETALSNAYGTRQVSTIYASDTYMESWQTYLRKRNWRKPPKAESPIV